MTQANHNHEFQNSHVACAQTDGTKAFCHQPGVPLTPIRRRVLQELSASATPLSAYDLTDRVRGPKKVAPVQVYRALEFLQDAGLIHRLATKSAYVVCGRQHVQDEAIVFLVCAECGKVQEAASGEVERGLRSASASNGFKASHPVVEVRGVCAACQSLPPDI